MLIAKEIGINSIIVDFLYGEFLHPSIYE